MKLSGCWPTRVSPHRGLGPHCRLDALAHTFGRNVFIRLKIIKNINIVVDLLKIDPNHLKYRYNIYIGNEILAESAEMLCYVEKWTQS